MILMTKESIDEFLSNNETIAQNIKKISENYSISDFVKVSKIIRDCIQNNTDTKVDMITGCIYNIREGYLRLDNESVENRLTREYLDYLLEILMIKENVDKVFYIVAYHYLALAKHLGYRLTATYNSVAPFPFHGTEMSALARRNYQNLQKTVEDRLFFVFNDFSEEDLKYYNNIYTECGYSYHATKHFSLIENLEGFVPVVSRYAFDYEFVKVLNVFIFKHRAIYTDEQLHVYIYRETKEKVINELVDVI